MNYDFLNKAPPWLVVLVLILMSGSGGAGVFSLFNPDPQLKQTLERINRTQEMIVNKLDALDKHVSRQDGLLQSHGWRLDNYLDRITGQAVKNSRQDETLQNLDRIVTQLKTRMDMP